MTYNTTDAYWDRVYSLIATTNNNTISISSKTSSNNQEGLQFEFETRAYTLGSCKMAHIRIYNASLKTFNLIAGINNPDNATQIVIVAGYIAQSGIIFSGQIIQQKIGRLSDGVTSFVDIVATDGDLVYSQGFIGHTISKGSSAFNRLTTISQQVGLTLSPDDFVVDTSTALNVRAPRGRTFYGRAIDHLRNQSHAIGAHAMVDGNNVTVLGQYNSTNAPTLIINSKTGLINAPVQTILGIGFDCLLNCRIIRGNKIQIDEALIQPLEAPLQEGAGGVLDVANIAFIPPILQGNGIYKVLFVTHKGNNRGNDWYTNVMCVSNPTSLNNPQLAYLGPMQL